MANRNRLRVLHLNLSGRGLGRYGALFARALAAHPDVEVLSLVHPNLLSSPVLQRVLQPVPLETWPLSSPLHKASLFPRLPTLIRKWRPDIIHDTAGSGFAPGVLATWAGRGRTPWVVTEHDPEPHLGMGTTLPSRWARTLIRRHAHHIFVHGPRGKEILMRQGVPEHRITVIYHGRLDPLFAHGQKASVPREPHTLLFFGALRPNKGIHLLVPIADRLHLKYPDLKMVVAGSSQVARELRKGPWPRELARILWEMRQRPYFEVHEGFIPDEDVAPFFQRASITLLPYLEATQSGVVMVAMPFGSVVLATRVGDLPFVIQDGDTGLLAKPQLEDIIERVDWALSHPQELERIRQNAQRWVERCRWEHIVARVVHVYHRLLGR